VAVLELVFERLALALECVVECGEREAETPRAASERYVAERCLSWLRHACSAAALRAPAGVALLSASPESGQPESQLAELLGRVQPAGSAAQQALRAGLGRGDGEQAHSWPLLDRLMCARCAHGAPAALLEQLTTLLLLLLFDRGFKAQFTPVLLRHYRALVACAPTGGSDARVAAALDRITVQLFNGAEATLALALQHGLLDCLLGLLGEEVLPLGGALLGAPGAPPPGAFYVPGASAAPPPCRWAVGAWAAGCADLGRGVGESRVLARALGDLRMVLAHPPVALHLLHGRRDLVGALLGVLAAVQVRTGEARRAFAWHLTRARSRCQGAGRVSRVWGDHVEPPAGGEWANAVALEQALVGLWGLAVEAAAEAESTALSRGGEFSAASADAADGRGYVAGLCGCIGRWQHEAC
jgi:hypothetical protein